MKTLQSYVIVLSVIAASALSGCSTTATKSADIKDSLRASISQAGFKDVTVDQDRDKGVVTLTGHVAADADKVQVQSIAQSIAVGQVVSNQVEVVPIAGESAAKAINADLDKGIEHNLDAALIEAHLHEHVKYAVKNHVVTLTGEVNSQASRARAEAVASAVLNVQQVVNELQVKAQKASSSN
jgi:osmotically-inducible protein OsmY